MAKGKQKSGTKGLYEKKITIEGKRYSIYGHTMKELKEKEVQKRLEVEKYGYRKNSNITLNEFAEEWLERKSRHVKPSTVYVYRCRYNGNIVETIGKRKLKDIEKREVREFLEGVRKKSGEKNANFVLILLNMILKAAAADDVIIKNPVDGITKYKENPKQAATETIHRALTREEQAAFFEAIKGTYYEDLFSFILYTGVRMGEAGALTWGDVDNKKGVINITKTLSRASDGKTIVSDSPKTQKGKRTIPINDAIKRVLKIQREMMYKLYGLQGIEANNPVFRGSRGTTIFSHTINTQLKKAVEKMNDAGIKCEYFSVHALRDTFATRYIEAGGSPQILKDIMGHTSLAMTMDLYSHVMEDTKAEEMKRIVI